MKKTSRNQMTVPQIMIPTIKTMQADGSVLFRPGKPVIVEEMIGTAEAARIVGMSRRWIVGQCEAGRFKSAYKPGTKPRSTWRIARAEVLAASETEPK